MIDYNLEDLVNKYKEKNLFDIIIELSDEVRHLDSIARNVKKRKDIREYQFNEYRDHAGDFLFFLNCGITPAGIGLTGLRAFLPIIENLVKKGQLKPEVLDRFK